MWSHNQLGVVHTALYGADHLTCLLSATQHFMHVLTYPQLAVHACYASKLQKLRTSKCIASQSPKIDKRFGGPAYSSPHEPCFPKGKQPANFYRMQQPGAAYPPMFCPDSAHCQGTTVLQHSMQNAPLVQQKGIHMCTQQYERHRLCVDSLDSSGVSAMQLLPLGAQHSILCLIRIHPLSQLLKGVLKRAQVLIRPQVLVILFPQCLPTCRCW